MQRFFLGLLAGLACVLTFNSGCAKLDSTVLGEDLIAIDNVSTFDTTLPISATRDQLIDTTRISRSETHALGSITNDPIFGKTEADIFLELKPPGFPFRFGNVNDTINPAQNAKTHFDSAFLCLSVVGFYGDTTKAQHLKVYQLDESTNNFTDTIAHRLDFLPIPSTLSNLIGEGTVDIRSLRNYTFLGTSLKDSVSYQIRIKLTPAFLAMLTSGNTDSASANNFFRSDSLFRQKFKGFAIMASGSADANGLFYIGLADANTRLEVHYVALSSNKLDTAFSSLTLSNGTYVTASATANYIKRDTGSSEFSTHPDDSALYVQATPGSAIRLTIPGLKGFPNSIIHRAEIFLDEVPAAASPLNEVLTPPQYLYLDLINDTGTSATRRYKPIYYDLSPNEYYAPDNTTSFFPSAVDNGYFGGYLRTLTDGSGKRSYYTFNLTRYVQNMITKSDSNYKMRVYAPYNLNYYGLNLLYKNNLAYGRVKLYNGSDPKYRIRMRIIYSKI